MVIFCKIQLYLCRQKIWLLSKNSTQREIKKSLNTLTPFCYHFLSKKSRIIVEKRREKCLMDKMPHEYFVTQKKNPMDYYGVLMFWVL